jgi:hypothetical protein
MPKMRECAAARQALEWAGVALPGLECAVAEPKDPSLQRMRDWPMFRAGRKKPSRRARSSEGGPLPGIADLVMQRLPGTPAEKLTWLLEQKAAGRLDGDDPDEIAQAEALLTMLVRLSVARGGREKRHLDELLDEGLRETFPASDPVAVGQFTGTEPPSRPIGSAPPDVTGEPGTRRGGRHARRGRAA